MFSSSRHLRIHSKGMSDLLLVILSCHVLTVVTRAAVIPQPAGVTGSEDTSGSGPSSDVLPRHHSFHRGKPPGGLSGCIGCRQKPEANDLLEEELIQLQIEKIKQEILSRLGLASPPNVSINRVPEKIPEPLRYDDEEATFEHTSQDSVEDESTALESADEIGAHSKQIIVFGSEVHIPHKRSVKTRHRLHFALPTDIPLDDVISVELWLYKDRDLDPDNCANTNRTLSVHSLVNDQHYQRSTLSRKPLALLDVPPHSGWFHVDLVDSSRSWIESPTTNRRLDIDHTDCVGLRTGRDHRPFLAIGTRRRHQRRRKRDAQPCLDGSQNCCRLHSLYINFRELGWNFVVSPAGYYANYCRGPCSVPSLENLVNAYRAHSALLQKFSRLRNNTDVLPCCSANSHSGLSMLYLDDKNRVIREDLDNMKVESCGCS